MARSRTGHVEVAGYAVKAAAGACSCRSGLAYDARRAWAGLLGTFAESGGDQ
jgi:hypothetical protein